MSETVWDALATVPHRLGYLEAGGVRTRVLEAGAGRPLVLLHGTGGHLEAYARNVGPLAERFRVCAFDIVGHGFSDCPAGYRYDWEGLSAHVLAVLDELGIERPAIVGEGVGAQIAQWIAIHHRERIAGAVLAGTIVVPVEDARDGTPTPEVARFQELSRRALEQPTRELIRARMEWLMLDPATVTDELVDLRLATWLRDDLRDAQRRILASYVKSVEEGGLRVTRAEAQAIETPLLIVWSAANPLMSPEIGSRFASYPSGPCRYVELERSGLWPQFEEPDRFNELVAEFAESVFAATEAGT